MSEHRCPLSLHERRKRGHSDIDAKSCNSDRPCTGVGLGYEYAEPRKSRGEPSDIGFAILRQGACAVMAQVFCVRHECNFDTRE